MFSTILLLFYFCLAELIVNDPVFSKEDYPFLSSEEAYDRSMQKSVHYLKIREKHDFDLMDQIFALM